jgi:hypothetical protein
METGRTFQGPPLNLSAMARSLRHIRLLMAWVWLVPRLPGDAASGWLLGYAVSLPWDLDHGIAVLLQPIDPR